MSIYTELKEQNCLLDHHESDLYCKVDDNSTTIVNNYEFKRNVERFYSEIDNALWFDIPFAFDPFWANNGGK